MMGWEELLEFLPPLLLLFFLAFSPGIMRFIQKRVIKRMEARKNEPQPPPETRPPREPEIRLTRQANPERVVRDSAEEKKPGPPLSHNSALSKVNHMSPLKKAVVWAEILGSPGGKGSHPDREQF